jgi:hypothetical protein
MTIEQTVDISGQKRIERALLENCVLVTRNIDDFKNITNPTFPNGAA